MTRWDETRLQTTVEDLQVKVFLLEERVEAIEKTLESGKIHTYSRSRGRLALKGEKSGHFQMVKQFLVDCDLDVVLFKVEQIVGACHEGYRSCFFRKHEAGRWQTVGERAFDPDEVYHK